MTDETKLHDQADEIRAETAADAPELQEHDKVAELERALAEAQQQTLYAQAETQNVRRRLEKEKSDAQAYAATGFAREMLSIADNMGRALAALSDELRADERIKPLVTGIEMTAREIDSVFQRNGVTKIDAMGQKLDPNRHQAMMELPSDQEPGTIVQELQPGYMLRERLLRPALVGVAKAG